MMNGGKDMTSNETAKRTCASCATFHGIYAPKACTFRADFHVAGRQGVWVCSGCYHVAMDARAMVEAGNTYAFGESA
jgi:hypothetical protein